MAQSVCFVPRTLSKPQGGSSNSSRGHNQYQEGRKLGINEAACIEMTSLTQANGSLDRGAEEQQLAAHGEDLRMSSFRICPFSSVLDEMEGPLSTDRYTPSDFSRPRWYDAKARQREKRQARNSESSSKSSRTQEKARLRGALLHESLQEAAAMRASIAEAPISGAVGTSSSQAETSSASTGVRRLPRLIVKPRRPRVQTSISGSQPEPLATSASPSTSSSVVRTTDPPMEDNPVAPRAISRPSLPPSELAPASASSRPRVSSSSSSQRKSSVSERLQEELNAAAKPVGQSAEAPVNGVIPQPSDGVTPSPRRREKVQLKRWFESSATLDTADEEAIKAKSPIRRKTGLDLLNKPILILSDESSDEEPRVMRVTSKEAAKEGTSTSENRSPSKARDTARERSIDSRSQRGPSVSKNISDHREGPSFVKEGSARPAQSQSIQASKKLTWGTSSASQPPLPAPKPTAKPVSEQAQSGGPLVKEKAARVAQSQSSEALKKPPQATSSASQQPSLPSKPTAKPVSERPRGGGSSPVKEKTVRPAQSQSSEAPKKAPQATSNASQQPLLAPKARPSTAKPISEQPRPESAPLVKGNGVAPSAQSQSFKAPVFRMRIASDASQPPSQASEARPPTAKPVSEQPRRVSGTSKEASKSARTSVDQSLPSASTTSERAKTPATVVNGTSNRRSLSASSAIRIAREESSDSDRVPLLAFHQSESLEDNSQMIWTSGSVIASTSATDVAGRATTAVGAAVEDLSTLGTSLQELTPRSSVNGLLAPLPVFSADVSSAAKTSVVNGTSSADGAPSALNSSPAAEAPPTIRVSSAEGEPDVVPQVPSTSPDDEAITLVGFEARRIKQAELVAEMELAKRKMLGLADEKAHLDVPAAAGQPEEQDELKSERDQPLDDAQDEEMEEGTEQDDSREDGTKRSDSRETDTHRRRDPSVFLPPEKLGSSQVAAAEAELPPELKFLAVWEDAMPLPRPRPRYNDAWSDDSSEEEVEARPYDSDENAERNRKAEERYERRRRKRAAKANGTLHASLNAKPATRISREPSTRRRTTKSRSALPHDSDEEEPAEVRPHKRQRLVESDSDEDDAAGPFSEAKQAEHTIRRRNRELHLNGYLASPVDRTGRASSSQSPPSQRLYPELWLSNDDDDDSPRARRIRPAKTANNGDQESEDLALQRFVDWTSKHWGGDTWREQAWDINPLSPSSLTGQAATWPLECLDFEMALRLSTLAWLTREQSNGDGTHPSLATMAVRLAVFARPAAERPTQAVTAVDLWRAAETLNGMANPQYAPPPVR